MTQPSITCPDCGMTSYNPNDILYGYCGNCHDVTARPCSTCGLRTGIEDPCTYCRKTSEMCQFMNTTEGLPHMQPWQMVVMSRWMRRKDAENTAKIG